MRTIAVLSDSHGNYSALQAVLADAKDQGVTDYLVVGDMVNRGPRPHEVTAALQALHPLAWVIGNHEEVYQSLLAHQFKGFEDNAKAIMAVVTSGYDRSQLSADEFRFYASRPLQQDVDIDGLILSVFHATPTSCRGSYTAPDAPQDHFDSLFEGSNALIALYGHTHQPLLRPTTHGQLVLNPGSIGQAVTVDLRLAGAKAEYGLLRIDDGHFAGWEQRNVPYDLAQEIEWAKTSDLPYANLYLKLIQTGGFTYNRPAVAADNLANDFLRQAQQLIEKDPW
ncbi:metallophosphoesterase family protein [Lacticaseibacillus yichunensis]|uniref:Metallophosphoesterase family protein n=1 Tax=Lacticaseibacillus yichunensis TaxID=2486015 RepID=A0ABW4CSI6_9LACO|nr:metallophosphoesterase family protein [Lacticaseibacillus yichunensis]